MSGGLPGGRGTGGGGRGGWSGGRGGGWSGGRGGGSSLSQSKEFLKRSAQEAGLDDRHIKLLSDITRPAFYPDVLWRANGDGYWHENSHDNHDSSTDGLITTKRSPSIMNTIQKQRELMNRFQKSYQYVRPDVMVDIERYSTLHDAAARLPPDVAVLQSLGRNRKLATDGRYFPTELIFPNRRSSSNDTNKKKGTKNKRTKKISSNLEDHDDNNHNDDNNNHEDSDDDEDDDPDNPLDATIGDEDEEEDVDYTTNYYDSDNNDDDDDAGGGGDDDHEATFD